MRLKKLQLLLLAALLALFSSRVRCQYPPPSSSPAPSSPAVNVTEVVAAVRKSFSEPTAHSFALKTELNLNGSSISVGESFDANTLVVQVGGARCRRRQGCGARRQQRQQQQRELRARARRRLNQVCSCNPTSCAATSTALLPMQFRFNACAGVQLHHHRLVLLLLLLLKAALFHSTDRLLQEVVCLSQTVSDSPHVRAYVFAHVSPCCPSRAVCVQ